MTDPNLFVAYGTFIITIFAVIIAFLLGKSTFKYQSEIYRIRVETEERIDNITQIANKNAEIIKKVDLLIVLMRKIEGIRASREVVVRYFDKKKIDFNSDVRAISVLESFEHDLSRREVEMYVLENGPSSSLAPLNSLVETLGDKETIEFLVDLKSVYSDDRSLLDKYIGVINSRINGSAVPSFSIHI